MSFRRTLKYALATALLALSGLVVWEAYAVWKAETRTEAILSAWLAKPRPLALAALSPAQKDILLKVEDPGFYDHKGIDLASPGQGMTTITQALVKFLYFEPFRPGFAKIEQSLIARFVVDRHLSKDQQLVLFINHAYLGKSETGQVRGFAAAAQAHFGKPFEQLNRDEFIGLVAMLLGPNDIRPDRPAAFNERVIRIDALLAGRCQPADVLDVTYDACGSAP
ncbi:transglycosylase domain-containing protein [Pelagibius litoralis]|uniref:Transglycosylase domain-containing protein n=1 Tax=Pelagibius litoralis TaxID=374515 RepID=A0A967EZ61_9PROT|nr:biosynthetic peptidoglycan transglycosylase [Pelagibius litoralis]NIA70059.1 transglycosylase domain-containing protein [Pelagibius litoralis]